MGMAYPLINDIIQKKTSEVGRRAGLIYLWNSVGALLGSLVAGFILLPSFGMQTATVILCLVAFLSTLPILLTYSGYHVRKSSLSQTGFLLAGFFIFLTPFVIFLNQPRQWLVKNNYLQSEFYQF